MSRVVALRALSRRLHAEQARLVLCADNAERLGFGRTIAPGLRQQAEQLGLYRLTVDAVADLARDPRGARRG